MSDRLRHTVLGLLWDLRVSWRVSHGCWFTFRDVPQAIVARWAATAPARFDGRPMLGRAIVQAQGELELRRLRCRGGARTGSAIGDAPDRLSGSLQPVPRSNRKPAPRSIGA